MIDDEADDRADRRRDREGVLASRLHVLARQTPVTTGWLNPDVIRQQVVRRRRRRIVLGGTATAVVAACAVTLALTSGGNAHPPVRIAQVAGVHVGERLDGAVQLVSNSRPSAARSASVTQAVQAQQTLAIKLLRSLGNSSRNVSVSPSSLQLALAMLENGARGTTQSEIAKALQTPGLSPDAQNAELAALSNRLSDAARGHLSLESANSIWQQQGYPLRHAFLAALSAYHAGVWQTNFRTSQGLDAVNRWTDTNTHGKIPKLFDDLDPSTVLVLANALYLHADWQHPFQAAETSRSSFTTATDQHVPAQFMTGDAATRTARESSFDAAQLPYRGGRFAALVVMPTKQPLSRFVDDLTPARLTDVLHSLGTPRGGIELPRFTTSTTSELIPALRELGMRQAFTHSADFGGVSRDGGLYVDQVVQRVNVDVGEKGTTAAAATGIGVSVSGAAYVPILFDQPFLFLVRDTVTGAILFASEINNPDAG